MYKNIMKNIFKIIHKSKNSSARIGTIKTQHGTIDTPFFMPIATYGAVKHNHQMKLKNCQVKFY